LSPSRCSRVSWRAGSGPASRAEGSGAHDRRLPRRPDCNFAIYRMVRDARLIASACSQPRRRVQLPALQTGRRQC
jgi:hypothetical protein